MCGRFVVSQKVTDLTDVFDAENDYEEWEPRFSLAPTDTVPIVREPTRPETGQFVRRLEPAVWNFHPAFMHDSEATAVQRVASRRSRQRALEGRVRVGSLHRADARVLRVDGSTRPQAGPLPARVRRPARSGGHLDGAQARRRQLAGLDVDHHPRGARRQRRDPRSHAGLPAARRDRPLPRPDEARRGGMQAMVDFLVEASDRVAPTITEYEVDPRVNNQRRIDPTDPTLIDPLEPGDTLI